MSRWLSATVLWLYLPLAVAAIDAFPFEDPESEARYRQLTEELRCLVCQNQNLADSNAELALDLRRRVYEMVVAGQSNEAIVDYMVARYGDFVLYRPPVRPATYLLWFGPVLLFIVGTVVLVTFVRSRMRDGGDGGALSEAERQKLEQLLRDDSSDGERK